MTVAWRTEYNGRFVQQVENFAEILRPVLSCYAFSQIIEIGTGYGGFSRFLQDCLPAAEIDSWDITQHLPEEELRNGFFTFHQGCAMHDQELLRLLRVPGRVLLICDGGDKIAEFRKFAPYLKRGDIIMAHDYCETRAEFENQLYGKLWNWLEITREDIAETIQACQLFPIHHELRTAAWGCWIKQ
jgi:hypothetical protein